MATRLLHVVPASIGAQLLFRSMKWRTHSNLVVRVDQAFFHKAGGQAGNDITFLNYVMNM